MKTERRWKTIAVSFVTLLIAAGPALAQSHASRIEALEAKAEAMLAEIAALRAELEQARESESARWR